MNGRSREERNAILRRRRSRPTITDVARAAGVSTGTVSHVLNGSRAVGAERREQVMRAIKALGYVPNIMAQSLRRKRATLVGLCMPHMTSGYFVSLADKVEELAARAGYDVLHVFSRYDGSMELHRVETLLRYDTAGVLLLPGWQPDATLERLAQSEVPTVILDRPSQDLRFDQVTVDVAAAMRQAAAELLALGHQRIAFVSAVPDLLLSRRRIKGLRDGIRAAGSPAQVLVVQRSEDPVAFQAEFTKLMAGPDRPTALVVTSSPGVALVVKGLRQLGLTMPADVSLLAVNQPAWADVVSPTLAGIRPPARAIAEQAWDLLLSRMQGRRQRTQRIALKPEFQGGASMGPAPKR